MRTTTVLVFLCLALVAQASWLENLSQSSWFSHLLNHTKLRGKLDLNTDNGLKVDYNAKLGYENGKVAISLADVGANFNAERRNSTDLSKDGNDRAFNYTAALAVNQNGNKANVTVDGLIELHGEGNKTNDTDDNNTHHYGVHIKNTNQWTANANKFQVNGGHYGKLNLSGKVHKNGSFIKTHHKVHSYAQFSGNVTNDGENVGFGFYAKGGDAKIHNNIFLTGGKAEEVEYQGHRGVPDAVSSGKAKYRGFTKFGWNNKSQGYSKEGEAEFEGIAWTMGKDKDNNTFRGFLGAQNIDYAHKGQIYVDNKKIADTLSVGDVAVLKHGGFKVNEDGTWEKGFGSTGALNQWTVGKFNGKRNEDSSSAENGEDSVFGNHKNKFLAKFKANWAHHVGLNGSTTDANSTNIDFKSGTLYKFGGHDSITKKPWEHHGYKTVTGNYIVGSGDDQPGNLTINF